MRYGAIDGGREDATAGASAPEPSGEPAARPGVKRRQSARMNESRNTMRRIISSVAVSIVFGGFTVAAAQLPPEIMMDRYLVRVEWLIAGNDYETALDTMNEIVAFQREHDLTLPEDFHFKYAQVALGAGSSEAAIDSVTRYLVAAGREGEFYREALELLDKAEAAKAAAEAAAEAAMRQAGETRVFDGMEFVWVPAGEFRMGSTRVRISRGFWLGKYEVTQAEWQGVLGTNPSGNSGCGQCPVEQVFWNDAQDFIRRMNGRAGRNRYGLPTEAEWEYAARAGTTGNRYGNLDAIAWYRDNSGDRTHPVGQKVPNAWGLYDMLGNVWEWVADWHGEYPSGAVTDPRGPASGPFRVVRGGSWINPADSIRASYRPGGRTVGDREDIQGFRLLRREE